MPRVICIRLILDTPASPPVEEYLGNLLHLKRFQKEFDIMYGDIRCWGLRRLMRELNSVRG